MPSKNKHLVLKAGLGIAAVAAAAGTYYFFGKDGKKHRAKAATWVDHAKKDVVKEVSKLKNVSERSYTQAVNKIITKYKKLQKDHPEEVKALSQKLVADWKKIEKHLPVPAKTAVRKMVFKATSTKTTKSVRKVVKAKPKTR